MPQPPPEGFAERWIDRYVQGRQDGSSEGFAIVGDGGEFLGLALAPAIARDPEWTAELGYAVAEATRGRGVATQALRLLTDWAFAQGILRAELIESGRAVEAELTEADLSDGFFIGNALRGLIPAVVSPVTVVAPAKGR